MMKKKIVLWMALLVLAGCASTKKEARRELLRTDTFSARLADDLEVRFTDVVVVARRDSAAPELRAAELTLSRSRRAQLQSRGQTSMDERREEGSEPAVKPAGFAARVWVALGLLAALAVSLMLGRGRR